MYVKGIWGVVGTTASEDDEAEASEEDGAGGRVEFGRRKGAEIARRAVCCDSRSNVLGSKRRMMRGVLTMLVV
jgi:hypothetical protein